MGILNIFRREPNQSSSDAAKQTVGSSASLTDNQAPSSPKDNLDEQFRTLSLKGQEYLKSGNLGAYAVNLYYMSEIHRKEKHYNDQLNLLFISSYIHLSGYSDPEMYNFYLKSNFSHGMVTPVLPPANIRAIGVASKRLKLNSSEIKKLFLDAVDVTLTPIHLFTKEECADVILLYVEGNGEKAEQKIKAAEKRFIKANKKKV